MKPIYLDYAASTPIDERVAKKMQACLACNDLFGNSASRHFYGQKALDIIETARAQVASMINADANEIIWTSGATESNNLALKGVANLYQNKGSHIITMSSEHKAVLDTCQFLEKKGYKVSYLQPNANGLLNLDELKETICAETLLVSIMHVNNETGIKQNLAEIAEVTTARNVLFHVDAAQSLGKAIIDVKQTPIDLLSLSAHKVYGPKGIGALYLRKKPRVRVEPLIHGGGHEFGMRSGTLATHQIVGMGAACEIANQEMTHEFERIEKLQHTFLQGLSAIKNLKINGELHNKVPHILSLRFDGMLAEAILTLLPSIAASTASACQGSSAEGSYVLRSMGLSDDEIKSSVRFSFGRFTTEKEIAEVVTLMKHIFH